MKVYDCEGFPNPLRVRMALAAKSMLDRVAFVPVDVAGGEHRRAPFLTINPAGTVPALELRDGTVIGECTAVTEYLDHLDGEPTLTGRTALERGMIHMMQRRAEAGLLDAVAAYFHHATPGLGPDIETWQCPDWGHRQKLRALDGMRDLDDTLGRRDWLAGSDFSMADITAYAGLRFAGAAGVEVPEACARLRAFDARTAALGLH